MLGSAHTKRARLQVLHGRRVHEISRHVLRLLQPLLVELLELSLWRRACDHSATVLQWLPLAHQRQPSNDCHDDWSLVRNIAALNGRALDALTLGLRCNAGIAPPAGTLGAFSVPDVTLPVASAAAGATSPLAGLSFAAVPGLPATLLPLMLLLPGCVAALPLLLLAAALAVLLDCGTVGREVAADSSSSSSSPASAAAGSASSV